MHGTKMCVKSGEYNGTPVQKFLGEDMWHSSMFPG